MDLGISGRVALVGGATQGIGRAVAEALVAEGARVVVSARDEGRSAGVAAEIGAEAGNAERSAALAACKTLALQVAKDGATINTLLTGQIGTARIVGLYGSMDAAEAAAADAIPAGRLGRPEEMGWAAAFLCSDRAAYITGTAIAVDGGALRGI